MSDSRRLALELHEIRQMALGHATNPQFGNASVDGDGLSFRDSDGKEIGRIGGDDGNGLEIRYVDAPKPLPPTAPVATGDANLIRVEWDGGWVRIEGGTPVRDLDAIDAPAVDRVEVHASMDENFVPDPVMSFAGVMPVTPEGGKVPVGPLAEAGDYYVVLMARGKDGQYSAPSERTHVVTTVGAMENELFDLALRADEARESADGKNAVHYGEEPEAPEGGFSEGDLWFDTTEDPETGFRKNMPHLWDPSANDGQGGWVSAEDGRVQALQDAQESLREDVENIVVDANGNATFWLPEEPDETTEPTPKTGDIWFNTSDGNKLHRFDGQGWVSASDSRFQTIQDAQDDFASHVEQELSDVESAASAAQQAADDALAAINAGDALWGDPGFEVGYGPIGDGHPDINRSTVHAYQGAWSMEYATNGDGALVYPGLTAASVTPGRVYRLSAAVRSDDGLMFQSWVQQRSADGSLIRAEDHFNVPGGVGSWALGSEVYEIAEGTTTLRLSPLVPASDNGTAGQKLYLDNFTLTDITDGYAQYREALLAAQEAQETAGEAKALAEAAVGAAEGGNTNFFNTSPPTGVGSLVGDRWFQRDTSHAIIGMWLWDGDNWVRQTLNNEVIGNLDAGKITTGYLEGARIKAGSITADRLVVGVSQNLLVDSLFNNAEINAARATAVWQPVEHGVETHFEASGSVLNASLYLTTDGSPNTPETRLAVDSSISWSVQVDVKVGPGAAPIDRMFFSFVGFRADGSGRFSTARLQKPGGGTQVTSADGWVRMVAEYDWSVVGDVVMVAPRLLVTQGGVGGGAYSVRNPFVGEQSGATLIKDGAITTDKIAVGAVTAESGIIASLDAGKITVGELDGARIKAKSVLADSVLIDGSVGTTLIDGGAITTEKIATGAITAESGIIGSLDAGVITTGELRGELIRAQSIAGESLAVDAIDGKTITGATIRTSSVGARVEFDADGLRQYNAFNQPIVEMVNGDVTVVGALYSGLAGESRVQIDSAIYTAPEEIPEGAMPDPGGTGAGIRLGRDKTSGVDLYYGLAQRNTSELLNTFMVDAPIGDGKTKLYMSDAGAVTLSGENASGPDSNKTQLIMMNDQFDPRSLAFRGAPKTTIENSRDGLVLSRMLTGSDRNGGAQGAASLDVYGHTAPSGSNYASLDLTAPTATGQGTFRLSALGAGGSSHVLANTSSVSLRSHIGSSLTMTHSGSASGRVNLNARESLSLRSINGNVDVNGSQVVLNASTQVTLGTTRVFWEDIPNAPGGTPLAIFSNGSIGKDASSRRYKIAEEPLAYTDPDFFEKLLSVEPKTWHDKASAEYQAKVAESRQLGVGIDPDYVNPGPLRRQVGAIAEDLDEAGLGLLVSYASDGAPESILYDRIGAVLIPVVKSLRGRVNELEKKMGEMANA